jgi:transcriptional antiterminator NusG
MPFQGAKVAQTIKEKAAQQNLTKHIEEVTVPCCPCQMDMNESAWHLVQNVPRVTGFLGANGKPQALSEAEAGRIFKQMQDGIDHPKPSVMFEVGENVKIIDGPFESFIGAVEEVDEEKARLKLSVSIFGRPTPVDLEFTQVEKV